ncbi:MAG: Recombinase [Planctomycetaceae bacterium]|nr:Recombinase [Planctomycetaceae bacterium]
MAKIRLSSELTPKNGRKLKVLGVCRISTENQKLESLDGQEALLRNWISDRYDGEIEIKIIASRGSGEILDRAEALQIETEAATCGYDLVIAEDLGRIYRRLHALIFCESCQDYETRVVAINDHLDTGQPDWKLHGFFAAMRHEAYNADTSKRIRRQLRDNFTKGGAIQTFQYGYIKPPGAKSDAEVRKDPDAEAVYSKWFEILESGGSYSEVADWLNFNQIPQGKYGRGGKWTCSTVARMSRNPILKGIRQRNKRKSIRVNKTGRHKQVKAAEEDLLERNCPHLAFIEPARYDRIIELLTKRNAHFRRKLLNGKDSRVGIPKKRTRWPGQHLTCGVCGGTMEYGAHGQSDHLICSNARGYRCWMGISVDGPKAKQKLSDAIAEQLKLLPEFDSELLAAAREEAELQAESRNQKSKTLSAETQKLSNQIERLMNAIKEFGASAALMAEMQNLEGRRNEIFDEQQEIARQPAKIVDVPSADDVRSKVCEALSAVLGDDPAAMRLVHQLIPTITVFPFRSIHGGSPVLRAKFTLNFAAIDAILGPIASVGHPWHVPLEIDLFDPIQQVSIREDVKKMKAEGLTNKVIAPRLGVTLPVVTQAIKLQKEMDLRKIDDPYQLLTAPPEDYSKLRRHLHPRFRPIADEDEAAA